ncbi:hypothetical protein ACA910_017629 [Epithemia clementina (nom. ined.)]
MNFDLLVLEKLTEADEPPDCLLRPSKHGSLPKYVFGDASGTGFGVSKWAPGDLQIQVVHGVWGRETSKKTSSNFCELSNLVYKIKRMDAAHELSDQVEIFIFTDNQHAESAFYRGTAKSPEVLELMFQLHRILIKGYALVHVIWVAGRRMIDQGTDGLSRANLTNGVMRGMSMFDFIPLAKTALERQGKMIYDFLDNVVKGTPTLTLLEPQDWFGKPQDEDGCYLWAPAPCLGDVAVYLLAEAMHIRPWNTQLGVLPSVMAGRWRKLLYKTSDFLCVLPFGEDLWPMATEYKPLTLAFVFPLLHRSPWRVKRSDVCLQQENTVRSLHRESVAFVRDYLREFWVQARALKPLPKGITRAVLSGI